MLNEKYNPLQRFIADNLNIVYCYFLFLTNNPKEVIKVIPYIMIFFIVNTIGNLLFSEILVVGIWGLSDNVKSEVIKRTLFENELMSLSRISRTSITETEMRNSV